MRALILAVLVACRVVPLPPPLTPEPDLGEAAAACARLDALGCPESRPLPDGRSCAVVLQSAAADGLISPRCIVGVKDRAGVLLCRVRCRE